LPFVSDAVVKLCDNSDTSANHSNGSGQRFLLAFVAFVEGFLQASDTASASGRRHNLHVVSRELTRCLQRHCATYLEEYKVPAFFVCVGGASGCLARSRSPIAKSFGIN